MPGNGDCISRGLTNVGPTVCVRADDGSVWLEGAEMNSAPSAALVSDGRSSFLNLGKPRALDI